jgi:hypothetical protein
LSRRRVFTTSMGKLVLRKGNLLGENAELVTGAEGAGEVTGIGVANQGLAIGAEQADRFLG